MCLCLSLFKLSIPFSLSKPDSLIFGFFQFSVGWLVMEVEIGDRGEVVGVEIGNP